MTKILITGASGFIGSFMVERALALGMETWAAVRPTSSRKYLTDKRIHFINLNLGNEKELYTQLKEHLDTEGRPFDYVIHAAGATKCRRAEDFLASMPKVPNVLHSAFDSPKHSRPTDVLCLSARLV